VFAFCLCGLQRVRGLVSSLRSSDVGSYNIYCRAFDDNGLPIECPVKDVQSLPNITSKRWPVASSPAKMLPQACLNDVGHGSWQKSGRNFNSDSLGARKRYAGPSCYYGPKSTCEKSSRAMLESPHSKKWEWDVAREHDSDVVWDYHAGRAGCPQYDWFQRDAAASCLTNTWVAFWGDSTTRLVFSALVDFLGDGIEDRNFPTHDFTYLHHVKKMDNCGAGYMGIGRCHLLVHFPERNTIVTFNFVEESIRSRTKYPDIWANLRQQRAAFPGIPFPKRVPDIVLMNNGPWEYYSKYMGISWMGNDAYRERFRQWMLRDFGKGASNASLAELPKLIVLKNTACAQTPGNCEASSVSCVEAMDNVDRLQREVIADLPANFQEGMRYLDGKYSRSLPPGYHCADTSYHLPGVVTDQRLNHALHAVCAAG